MDGLRSCCSPPSLPSPRRCATRSQGGSRAGKPRAAVRPRMEPGRLRPPEAMSRLRAKAVITPRKRRDRAAAGSPCRALARESAFGGKPGVRGADLAARGADQVGGSELLLPEALGVPDQVYAGGSSGTAASCSCTAHGQVCRLWATQGWASSLPRCQGAWSRRTSGAGPWPSRGSRK